MFDTVKSSPLSPEDLNKINTWRQQIANSKVENINNPTKEVLEEHRQIYDSLTHKTKWNECVAEAREKYYGMMTDLGYEHVEKRFTFFEPYLAYLESNVGEYHAVSFRGKQFVRYQFVRYDFHSLLKESTLEIISTFVHENIHANSNNKYNEYKNKFGLDVNYPASLVSPEGFLFSLAQVYEKIDLDWKLLSSQEIEFVQAVLSKNIEKLYNYFSLFSVTEKKLLSNLGVHFGREFIEANTSNIDIFNLKDNDLKKDLFYFLYYLKSDTGLSLILDGTNFDEGVTEYFASKYIKNFQSMSYRKYVEQIKNFIDKLPVNLQKSFERALMDAKVLSPKEGGGYPVLTRWFYNNLRLRISPLIFINLNRPLALNIF
jgi:hypothetical protein